MKKLMMAVIASLVIMAASTQKAEAQNKFGYFDLEYVVSIMPGVEKVDTLMFLFERDTLTAEYKIELDELQRMDSVLKKDSATMPAHLYRQRQQDQAQRYVKLQNWQQYSQQMMQGKQQELMAPYLNKVLEAFRSVVTENKYTYVFKQDALWDAPQGDNLVPLVAKKLGIKLPQQPQQATQAKPPAK